MRKLQDRPATTSSLENDMYLLRSGFDQYQSPARLSNKARFSVKHFAEVNHQARR
jgi:hypothetical protein